MPYEIIKSQMMRDGKIYKGYRVLKRLDGGIKGARRRYFSALPIPLEQAKRQRTALIIADLKRMKNPEEVIKDFTDGGRVLPNEHPAIYDGDSDSENDTDYGDTVAAILEPGELVIPVEHVPVVSAFLKRMRINLPNM